jgi:hypothetical protein
VKTLWEGTDRRVKPTVLQRPDGGLLFRYFAPFHTDCRCEFTLWCEVGRFYQPYFADFWVGHALSDTPLVVEERPYVFDRLKP